MTRHSVLLTCLLSLIVCAAAQDKGTTPQLVLENEFVRIARIAIAPKGDFSLPADRDVVLVRLQDETARFIPKGERVAETNTTDRDAVVLVIELRKHWDVEVHPCAFPKTCTRETRMGQETIAWTTTLFTNGFITGASHKVVKHGTLTSSYYSSKGWDKIVFVPFTNLAANFGGTDETLKAGQPYFSAATEVEVTGTESESRWFVLRINSPQKQ